MFGVFICRAVCMRFLKKTFLLKCWITLSYCSRVSYSNRRTQQEGQKTSQLQGTWSDTNVVFWEVIKLKKILWFIYTSCEFIAR